MKNSYLTNLHYFKKEVVSRKAFSLIEIVISLGILAVAFLPIAGVVMSKQDDTVVIESHRYAAERGFSIMSRIMQEVPFETLWESPSKDQPGSLKPQSKPSTVNGVVFDGTYCTKLRQSIFPGSAELCYIEFTDARGIVYEAFLEITDISDPSTAGFTGTTWSDPSTWKELYFDYYALPEFEKQPNWNSTANQNNDGVIGASYITPYKYYTGTIVGRHWGPAERKRNGSTAFKSLFPRDQKDRSHPWSDWGGKFCQMKKLRLRMRWNYTPKERKTPSVNYGRRQEIWLLAFKSNIF
ncbi:MAG: hypothetical protein HQM10_15345 [Candidatus Riflebacteria bacterium]|nr:hypothetical protein [Candidatus Riflebacteria bacterium]